MGSLALFTGLLRGVLGLFTTVSTEKRKDRVAVLKTVLTSVHVEGKKRSVLGWALVFMAFLGMVYDIVATGGQNFDALLQLVGVALTAG